MSPSRRRRTSLILVGLLVVVAAGLVLLYRSHVLPTSQESPQAAGDGSGGAGNGGGATTTAPYTIKPEPTAVATDKPIPVTTAGRVQVVLTHAGFDPLTGTVRANGYVAGVIKNGGTCTLTLTLGSTVVTARNTASADATTTSCGLLETAPGLRSGTWAAVLSYSADALAGESQSAEVVVP